MASAKFPGIDQIEAAYVAVGDAARDERDIIITEFLGVALHYMRAGIRWGLLEEYASRFANEIMGE